MSGLISNRSFRIGLFILLMLGIIYMARQVDFLFYPLLILFTTIFTPFIIAGILFYLSVGIVDSLERRLGSRKIAILLVLLLLLAIAILFLVTLFPLITKQLFAFINAVPGFAERLYRQSLSLYAKYGTSIPSLDNQFSTVDSSMKSATALLGNVFSSIAGSLVWLIRLIASTVFTLFIAVFLYVFMLVDGKKLPNALVQFIPLSYRPEALLILKDMNGTIRSYVRAQLIVCTFVGSLATLVLWWLDIPYFLPLGLFIFATNIIPYLGPFLGAAPAVLIGFLDEPIKGLYVIIGITVVQQLDANVISPLVQGKSLKVHPITITVVLLVAGQLAGILGMLLAVPFYAVAKVTVLNVMKLAQLRKTALLADKPVPNPVPEEPH
ncbi:MULTISPECIES: AI-2E family transporter [Exiguobacterium]|uniref:AI-2E family transporter n=1 Tax=Exiguobacterium TaxID=33986 RepID=UPI0020351EB8|nr:MULTISPECIES: AI-2E family transporter [Exiguobacterium]MCT4780415.1 AI-2E family transporter [Exiguobacterium soli]